jgi:outer membrane protein assembly factor BamB
MRRRGIWPTLFWQGVVLFSLAGIITPGFAGNWSQFRGDDGTASGENLRLPKTWSADKILWTVDLPGVGHSSPVIWANRVFLTSANADGTTRYLLCLNADTGKTLWTKKFTFGRGHKHEKNSWASSTPAVDGERVYFVFADSDRQIFAAYDFDGNPVWAKNLGSFASQHAQGTSPIVFEDLVILANDQDGPSSILACDRLTGHTVWSDPRKSGPQATSYATPFIYRPKDAPPELICASSLSGVSALDPHTGQTIWSTHPMPQRTVGSPVLAGGLLFQCCGAAGQGMLMIAVDPSGRGDVSKTHIRYTRKRLLPYVPTPVACGNDLFLWSDHGVVCCIDPKTGKDIWTRRVGGDFSSSPICVDKLLFNVDETGNVIVLSASHDFALVGRLSLGDSCHATPAAANGRLYFRTFHHLVCAGSRS